MAGSFARRSLTAVLSVALLGLIAGANALVMSDADVVEPIAHSGDTGSPVDARRFTIEVDRVQFARQVSDDDDGFGGVGPIEANGVWVVVWAELTSTSIPMVGADAVLDVGGGYTYSSSWWLSNGFGGVNASFDPGIPQYGAFVFEVPEKRLLDLTLRISLTKGHQSRLAAQAKVDLGLRGDELAAKAGAPEDSVSIPPPETR